MSRHSTQFEPTEGGLALSTAILLYRSERGSRLLPGNTFASIHPVEHEPDGSPVIGCGTPLTRAHLRQWTEALGRAAAPEILPGNVLAAHRDVLAWWVPAQVRPAYFALTATNGLKALTERKLVPVPYPAHLFVASRTGLGVYALPEDRRPQADTPVLHSPILNVFFDGRLCWGNIPRPKSLAVASIPEFERAVFDSWSTHPNPGQELTVTGKGGLVRLWDDLASRSARRFPVKRLKPFGSSARASRRESGAAEGARPATVGSVVAAGARR